MEPALANWDWMAHLLGLTAAQDLGLSSRLIWSDVADGAR